MCASSNISALKHSGHASRDFIWSKRKACELLASWHKLKDKGIISLWRVDIL
ncbi:hypothetical protein RO3G_11789 [Rhizopus delemar RA 99-880]|uniref:Uncharacterized protein n=1 Tax=Rhizopus delemar (strain RA 99-880 / ATCC MYA-4621 / FGSC 9543 / NRRL 43880) TaxID=246409 RepID=I1CF48_RHIO9|nr:hypothetical protein RO3G_11789 [Rhizopus delemar RA 99-880]|eukprot:EIE87078.1 hypothetical protein RO3G_11789 [Rhizopus delemar RA 99-880]